MISTNFEFNKNIKIQMKKYLLKNPTNKIMKMFFPIKKISLLGLLDKKNPYHDDFIPIYEIVSASETKKTY